MDFMVHSALAQCFSTSYIERTLTRWGIVTVPMRCLPNWLWLLNTFCLTNPFPSFLSSSSSSSLPQETKCSLISRHCDGSAYTSAHCILTADLEREVQRPFPFYRLGNSCKKPYVACSRWQANKCWNWDDDTGSLAPDRCSVVAANIQMLPSLRRGAAPSRFAAGREPRWGPMPTALMWVRGPHIVSWPPLGDD